MHGTHAATSKVENSGQGLSCQLKFVHGQQQANTVFLPVQILLKLEIKLYMANPAWSDICELGQETNLEGSTGDALPSKLDQASML